MTPRFGRPAADTWRDAYELAQKDFLKARAELSRIRTLLDREKLRGVIYRQIWPYDCSAANLNTYELADKLKAYLLGEEVGELG